MFGRRAHGQALQAPNTSWWQGGKKAARRYNCDSYFQVRVNQGEKERERIEDSRKKERRERKEHLNMRGWRERQRLTRQSKGIERDFSFSAREESQGLKEARTLRIGVRGKKNTEKEILGPMLRTAKAGGGKKKEQAIQTFSHLSSTNECKESPKCRRA
jgi:hypothetical protein